MRSVLVGFFIAMIVTGVLTPWVAVMARRNGFIDTPGPRKIHREPVPLLGGLAIYLGVVVAVFASSVGNPGERVFVCLVLGGVLLIVGILDDAGLLHHQIKLLAAMPLVGLGLVILGISIDVPAFFQWINQAVTVFWVVGIVAAFSILDHMDGLCAGVAGIAAAFFLAAALQDGNWTVAMLASSVLGASWGFLIWNFHPARVFMGDGGAMFLGLMVASLGLVARPVTSNEIASWLPPILILGVAIFDTTLVTVSRIRRGLAPHRSPGKDHTAHRLVTLGVGIRGTVLLLYGVGVSLGLTALVLPGVARPTATVLTVLVFVLGFLALAALERTGSPVHDQPSGPLERSQGSGGVEAERAESGLDVVHGESVRSRSS